jgi:hypothetical protein
MTALFLALKTCGTALDLRVAAPSALNGNFSRHRSPGLQEQE